jgi:hypothetical protein
VSYRSLVTLALACTLAAGCGDEDNGDEVPGLITMNSPAENPTLAAQVVLTGTRESTVDRVTWSNSAPGGGVGAATLTAEQCSVWPLGTLPCNHAWTATIPLVVGANPIAITGYGFDGFTRVTVTITRSP